jgi:3-hydroxyisobutyrate dehydrogenase-like beta-hydroxyacid dehydrogenase
MTPQSTTAKPRVAVLGLGPMGQALAGALLAAGHPTAVWNRTPEKAAALVARGATRAATPAAAARDASLVLGCLLDYHAFGTVLGDWPATTLVNLTTGRPDEARAMADRAHAAGIDYLEGAILSPTAMIGTPAATILYCGPEPTFDANRSTLAALGGTPSYLGADFGIAVAYDLALLDLFATAVSGVAHAFALASAEGIPPRVFAGYATGIGAWLPSMVTGFAEQLTAGEFPGDRSTITSASAGISHIIDAADRHGLDTGVLRAAQAVIDRAVMAGHGDDGLARLSQILAPATPALPSH